MDTWEDFTKVKPKLGQDILIYRQGYGGHNNYYSDYQVASYVKNPYDKRRYCFVPNTEKKKNSPWIYTKVTHWMLLPTPPEKIAIEIDRVKNTAVGWIQETFGR